MNKKLISKCCHSEVSESVYFTCLGCGQICEVIEIEEPQPIQKEEEDKRNVDNLSRAELYAKGYQDGVNAVEKDIDNFNKEVDLMKTPTPSDTFIEGIIKKFREQFVASDNRFLTGTETVGKAEKFIRQSFKSSLQEQRQSILEEIEKKIEELGIQADKADTQIQNEDFNEFFSKEDAEKLIYDNLIIIKTLEDIKQIIKPQ